MTKLPPGPQIPGLLQTLSLLADPIATLDRAIADYGDTFTLRVLGLGSPPVVFFSNPESIQAIFTTLAGSFDLGKVTHVFQPLVGDRSLIMEQGDRHRHQRQLLMPALHGEQLQGYGEAIVARTQDWLATQKPGAPIAIRREMAELSLDVILRVVFGLEPGPRYGELRGLLAEMLEAITSSAYSLQFFLPQLQQNLGPWSPWGGFVALRSRINALIYTEIADRKANPHGQDVLAMLVAAVDETGAGLTDDEIRDQLMTLLLLGHETTASALTWAFYWLTQSPESLTRLQSELLGLPNPDPMTLAAQPFLTAVCKEALRVQPIALISQPRRVRETVTLEGYRLEPGCIVVPCIYTSHRREATYPNARDFQPDRFLTQKFSAYEFFPFGGGARSCIGAALSQMEMKLILSTILRHWNHQNWHIQASPCPHRPQRRGITFVPNDRFKITLVSR
jgi:cytochrome P450 family 110